MKNIVRLWAIAVVLLVTGCAVKPGRVGAVPDTGTAVAASSAAPAVDDKVKIQLVEFRPGVSSVTVERLGRRYGCVGKVGAGLMTDKGPVEVYRMQCENGTTFMARCELRQCRPMR